MKPAPANYRDRVLACWLGKAVGGTLGLPTEGKEGPLDLSFYDPVPTTMLPNDDLDLQVLWACKLVEMGNDVRVDRQVFADAWLKHVSFPWDEYGVALRNLRQGIRPPLSGSVDNWFHDGMGAAIRSEIWACLAPGNPELAAQYAYEDACVDHVGDGIWAEVFLAALEAMAFVESDPARLLDVALAQIPGDSLLRQAIEDTVSTWQLTHDWRSTMRHVLQHYGHENFTDVKMNLAFTVLGWLAGEGDFSRAICTAVNCGKDTDCTSATVGALMGILNPNCIDEKWLRPIGRDLVVDRRITGINPPPTIDTFADMVCALRDRLGGRPPTPNDRVDETQTASGIEAAVWPLSSKWIGSERPSPTEPPQSARFGYWAKPAAGFWTAPQMAVRYRFTLPNSGPVRLMFNTRSASRVWFDDRLVRESQGQSMGPSFHRTLVGHHTDLQLDPGTHTVTAVIDAPNNGNSGEWVWGIGDVKTAQWLAPQFLT